jgi:RNA polymerase sigma-70 factor (ECF subfamily)
MADDSEATTWALAARAGDEEAAQQFVRATQLDVRRFVTHLSGDAQAADDLVQETYLRALRSLPGFEGRSSARTWLLTIARRAVADRIRASSCRPRLTGSDDWEAALEKAQPRGLPGFEEGIALSELLAVIDGHRREAFVLTQLLGLSYARAAAVIGCPLGTVRSRVARARESLISLLEEAVQDCRATEGTVTLRTGRCAEPSDRQVALAGSAA